MKKARFSAFARPYDIHNCINVFPNPASSVSITNVKVLSQIFNPSVETPSLTAWSSTNPLGLPVALLGGNSACSSASWTSIKY
jgi:hypothetical protein